MRNAARQFTTLIVGFALVIFSGAKTQAVVIITEPLTDWGTEASSSVADCPSFCTGFNFGPSENNPLQTSASSSISESRGSAEAVANLTGSLSTPLLRARGDANPSMKGAFGTAFGSQGYTYSGADTTLTLDVTLTGSVVDPDALNFRGEVTATVVVFEVSNYEFLSHLPTLLFEAGATPVLQTGGLSDARIDLELLDTGSIDETQSVSFDVSDGDQFYIWAILGADAVSSSTIAGSADAFNTLAMSFSNPTGLTPASGVIPAPASSVLLVCGLLVLAANGRRHRV